MEEYSLLDSVESAACDRCETGGQCWSKYHKMLIETSLPGLGDTKGPTRVYFRLQRTFSCNICIMSASSWVAAVIVLSLYHQVQNCHIKCNEDGLTQSGGLEGTSRDTNYPAQSAGLPQPQLGLLIMIQLSRLAFHLL